MVQINSIDMVTYTSENMRTSTWFIWTLGHLVRDAPEVLIGLASAFFGGKKVASQLYKMQKNSKLAKDTSLLGGLLASLALGYLGYSLTKKIKNF